MGGMDPARSGKQGVEDPMTEHSPTPAPEAPEGANQGAAEPAAPAKPASHPNAKWYILQTYSGFEHRVEKTLHEKLKVAKLQHLVEEIFVPGEDVERVKNGKKRKMHVIYYPGYVLVKMQLTDELWHVLMDTPRVAGFVGGTNRDPKPLQESELGEIRSQMTQGIRHAAIKDEFEVGQPVIVIDGPFANFSGKVGEVNVEKSRLKVFISILGRSTPVELDFDKVKAHPDAK
jgi:transcriptional antiterminator NusG